MNCEPNITIVNHVNLVLDLLGDSEVFLFVAFKRINPQIEKRTNMPTNNSK